MENLYTILGISETAGLDEIKRAYKKLAFKYHPDKNQGDLAAEEKFKAVNNAYQILSDTQQRAQYDLIRSYHQFQQTTTYTDYNNQYSRTYKNTDTEERRKRAQQYAESYTAERKKVARESMTIGTILIIGLLVIVGVYGLVENYIDNKRQEETNAQIASRIAIIESYYEKEDFRAAFEEVDLLVAGWPIHPSIRGLRDRLLNSLNNKAETAYKEAHFEKALEYYLVLQDIDKILVEDFDYKIAKCFAEQALHDEAINQLKKIVNKNPNDLQAWCEIGKILSHGKQDYEEASKYVGHAKKLAIGFYEQRFGKAYPMLLAPNSVSDVHFDIFYERAIIQKQLNKYSEAIKDCSWASFLRPDRAQVDLLRAECEHLLGNQNKACEFLSKAKQKNSEEVSNLNLAYCQ